MGSPSQALTARTDAAGYISDFTETINKKRRGSKALKAIRLDKKQVEEPDDALDLLSTSNQIMKKMHKEIKIFMARVKGSPQFKNLGDKFQEISEQIANQLTINTAHLRSNLRLDDSDDEDTVDATKITKRELTIIELLQEPEPSPTEPGAEPGAEISPRGVVLRKSNN